MNDVFTVKAPWAWYSKEPGSLDEYDVMRCAGGAERRDFFAQYITAAGLGNPPSARASHDQLPWVSMVGLLFDEGQWTGISVMEPSPLRDGANREVTPTRYFLLNSPELVQHRVGYVTLWDAVSDVPLPPERNDSVPLQVRMLSRHGLLTGLDRIADHMPGVSPEAETDLRRTAAARWAAAVAALLLEGGPVVITGGGALDTRTRLAVFDAVVGFLPYGVRGRLAVGSCLDGGDNPPTHLAFGPGHTPASRPVRLGALPQVAEGRPDQYRRRLTHLIEDRGFETVVDSLLSHAAPLTLSDHTGVLRCLDQLDPFQAAVSAVETGHESVRMIAEGLNSLTNGPDPNSADVQRLVRRGIAYVVEDSDRTADDALRRLWVEEDNGTLVSTCVAQDLLSVALSGATAGTDSSSCRERLSRLWQMVEDCGKEAEVLRLLSGSEGPDADQRLPFVVDFLCVLGPARVVGDGFAAAQVLWGERRLTLGLLGKESTTSVRLRQWLEALAVSSHDAPAWLRAWSVLLPGAETHAALLEPRPTPEDALQVLSATIRAERADWTADTVQVLWVPLCTLAVASRGNERAEENGRDGGTFTLPFRNRGTSRNPSPPDEAGEAGAQALVTALRADADVWQDCRAWADVLRCIVGLPAVGPQWREEACVAYAQSLDFLLRDRRLEPFLHVLLSELAEPVLTDPWDKEGETIVLAVLDMAPDQGAVAALRKRVAARNRFWHERQAAEEAARAAETRHRVEPQAVRAHPQQRHPAHRTGPDRRPAAAPVTNGAMAWSDEDSGRGPVVRRGGNPASGTGDIARRGERTQDQYTPLEEFAVAVRRSNPARDIATRWAPFVLRLDTQDGRFALEQAGLWWEKALNEDRTALFDHLELALRTEQQCGALATTEVLQDIRRLIVAGRAAGHGGGGWRARTILTQAKRDLRQQRSRVRELRRVRLLSFLNLSSGRPRRHRKRNKGISQ
ncbi:hypothetical protein QFZ24_006822 [Streptomyces phaeochromogenes]|uniref:hypothetical protein n=1 Tax=Streptomyces phaeochromogenes TaxID=1923 RepID=UPI00278E5E01|nr:hypothetical protein [Streptomyces phaeochromogenes]MDQ0952899.1 hypothetical protein [Streptomyces phaeochromogenes]